MKKILLLAVSLLIISIHFRDVTGLDYTVVSFNLPSLLGIICIIVFVFAVVIQKINIPKTLFLSLLFLWSSQFFLSFVSYLVGYDINVGRLFSFIQYYTLFILISSIIENENDIKKIFVYIVVSTTILSCFTVINFILNKDQALSLGAVEYRAFGGFRNPSYLALYLVSTFPILHFMIKNNSGYLKLIYFFMLFISLLALLLTFMRSAYLVFLSVIIYHTIRNSKSSIRTLFLSLIIIPIVFAGAFLLLNQIGIDILLIERLSQIQNLLSGTDSSMDKRATVMLGAIDIFSKNIFYGVGPGNLPYVLYKNSYTFMIRSAENTYLHIICEYGIFIVPILFLVIYIINKRYKTTNKKYLNPINLSIIGILLMSLFDNNQGEIIVYLIFAIRYSKYFLSK